MTKSLKIPGTRLNMFYTGGRESRIILSQHSWHLCRFRDGTVRYVSLSFMNRSLYRLQNYGLIRFYNDRMARCHRFVMEQTDKGREAETIIRTTARMKGYPYSFPNELEPVKVTRTTAWGSVYSVYKYVEA